MHEFHHYKTKELPENYDDNSIVLLVRDPHCLYAYWDASSFQKNHLYEKYGNELWDNSVPTLKVTNNTKNTSFYIRINDFCNDWYINLPDSNALYSVELGRKLSENSFVSIVTSNSIYVWDFDSNVTSAAYFVDYNDLKAGNIVLDSANINESSALFQNSSYIFGIELPEAFDFNMQEYALNPGSGSSELIVKNILRLMGISSQVFNR